MQSKKLRIKKRLCSTDLLVLVFCLVHFQPVIGQTTTDLSDLSAFKNPGRSWQLAGAVTADLNKQNILNISPGTGILVNLPDRKNHGIDLYTVAEYGDIDLELDYMMASGSNSGIYLHGRYELQLEDTWGSKTTTSGRNGGIYERWDDTRPEGSQGYGGFAPRQNASRAPGLWQHLKISFKAPRFDESGRKTQSARMLRVELNGVLIHENVELSGPTRGGFGQEKATGPLRIQGDHGAVAFRNIKITNFDRPRQNEDEGRRSNNVYPMLVAASASPVFRSFMDLPGTPRVVHAVSVGSEEKIHYTYDTDTGMILQVWRGDFLDATPMWNSRGDGSSRPAGAVLRFGNPAFALSRLSSDQSAWKTDTAATGFRSKGYVLDNEGKPVFRYRIHGTIITDFTNAIIDGQGIRREITIQKPVPNLYVRLAEGVTIVQIGKEMYLVDNNSYYLRMDDAAGAKPIIRDVNGRKELIVPIGKKVKYSILF
ncbi:MAG: DUF1080 domain-containing protein [Cyclobacteriaceae bacterium]